MIPAFCTARYYLLLLLKGIARLPAKIVTGPSPFSTRAPPPTLCLPRLRSSAHSLISTALFCSYSRKAVVRVVGRLQPLLSLLSTPLSLWYSCSARVRGDAGRCSCEAEMVAVEGTQPVLTLASARACRSSGGGPLPFHLSFLSAIPHNRGLQLSSSACAHIGTRTCPSVYAWPPPPPPPPPPFPLSQGFAVLCSLSSVSVSRSGFPAAESSAISRVSQRCASRPCA